MFKLESVETATKHPKLGVFEKIYHIEDDLTDEQEDQLGEWLSVNCINNFVMSKQTNCIFAGGCTNNLQAWTDRTTGGPPFDVIREYYIKLYKSDVTLFELVWLT
jgi:hypothetical protein